MVHASGSPDEQSDPTSPTEAPLAFADLRKRFEGLASANTSHRSDTSAGTAPGTPTGAAATATHHHGPSHSHFPFLHHHHRQDDHTHTEGASTSQSAQHTASSPSPYLARPRIPSPAPQQSSSASTRGPPPPRPPKPAALPSSASSHARTEHPVDQRVPLPPLPTNNSHHSARSTDHDGERSSRANSVSSISAVAAALEWAEGAAGYVDEAGGSHLHAAGTGGLSRNKLDSRSSSPGVQIQQQSHIARRDGHGADDDGSTLRASPVLWSRSATATPNSATVSPQGSRSASPSTLGRRPMVAQGAVSKLVPVPPPATHPASAPGPLPPLPLKPTAAPLPPLAVASPTNVPALPARRLDTSPLPPPPMRTPLHQVGPPLLRSQRLAQQPSSMPATAASSSESDSDGGEDGDDDDDDDDTLVSRSLPQNEADVAALSQSAPTGASAAPLSRTGAIGRAGKRGSAAGDAATVTSAEVLPDASRANRRPPAFDPPRTISTKHFSCSAVCGHTICIGSGDKVRVYRVGPTARPGSDKLCSLVAEKGGKEVKVTVMAFRPSSSLNEAEGRYLWCGTKEGHLWEMDIAEATVTNVRQNIHTAAVVSMERAGSRMITIDESGKICIWQPPADGGPLALSSQPMAQRVNLEKGSVVLSLGQQLWSCAGAGPSLVNSQGTSSGTSFSASATAAAAAVATFTSHHGGAAPAAAGPRVRIFNPFSLTMPFNATSRPLTMGAFVRAGVGAVTCGTILQTDADKVYLGHDSGHISIWDRKKLCCVACQRVSLLGFTALCAVGEFLWAGNRSGRITVYRPAVSRGHWEVLKSWPAHRHSVTSLRVDTTALTSADPAVVSLPVVSAGLDCCVHVWDGTLARDFVAFRLSQRVSEYSTYRSLRMLQVTFNIDAASPAALNSTSAAMEWLPEMLASPARVAEGAALLPDIICFGLQEVVDLGDKRLTAKSLILNAASKSKAKAEMSEKISHQYRLWYERLVQSVRLAMPPDAPYRVVLSESMVGLFTCIFVRASEAGHVSDQAVSTVKTGLGGRWGNKGAIVSRFAVDDTSCCFINAHLAAGQSHVKQRNGDVAQILESESLPAGKADDAVYYGGGDGALVLDHELVFVGGDLNYRIDLPRGQVLAMIQDGDWEGLVARDQLCQELRRNSPSFRLRGFSEAGALRFAPTYKFDRNTDEYDTSEKNRTPAWCDRLLYRDALARDDDGGAGVAVTAGGGGGGVAVRRREQRVRCLEYRSWPALWISDHRPVSAVYEVQVKRVEQATRERARREEVAAGEERRRELLRSAAAFYVGMWEDVERAAATAAAATTASATVVTGA
ncbi:unnamed protein product [Parajaminaea phylloscopi]